MPNIAWRVHHWVTEQARVHPAPPASPLRAELLNGEQLAHRAGDLAAGTLSLVWSGCQTTKGFGRDVEHVGDKIEGH